MTRFSRVLGIASFIVRGIVAITFFIAVFTGHPSTHDLARMMVIGVIFLLVAFPVPEDL